MSTTEPMQPQPPTTDDLRKWHDIIVRRDGESPEDHHERQIIAYQEAVTQAELLFEQERTKAHAENCNEIKEELLRILRAPLARRHHIVNAMVDLGFDNQEARRMYEAHTPEFPEGNYILAKTGAKTLARRILDAAAEAAGRQEVIDQRNATGWQDSPATRCGDTDPI